MGYAANTTQINQSRFVFHTRIDKNFQDVKIINEVIAGDQYELKDMAQNIEPPKLILDIGGHIGTFGCFAKSFWPEAKIIALEPNPTNAELYRKNLYENFGDTESIVINKALSYDPKINYYLGGSRTTGGGILINRAFSPNMEGYRTSDFSFEVKTMTLEQLLFEQEIETVDLIKWDCEGAEFMAFRDMTMETKKKLGYMVGEVHIDRGVNYLIPSFRPTSLFDYLLAWKQIMRWMPTHFFDYQSADGSLSRYIFKAWPKGN